MKKLIVFLLAAVLIIPAAAALSVSAEVSLVSGDRDYTVSGSNHGLIIAEGNWPCSYNADLTDGVTSDVLSFEENVWFSISDNALSLDGPNLVNGVCNITLDLGEVKNKIALVKVHMYGNDTASGSGVHSPDSITVSVSENGITFTQTALCDAFGPDNAAAWTDIDLGAGYTARYVKFRFASQYTHVFIDEIQVYTDPDADDAVIDYEEGIVAAMGDPAANTGFTAYLSVAEDEVAAGSVFAATVSIDEVTADNILILEFEIRYDSSKLALVYDDDSFGDDDEFLFEATHPGSANSWKSLSRFDPADPGVIRINYMTETDSAVVTGSGQVVITLYFRAIAGVTGQAGIWVPNTDNYGSDISLNQFNGKGSYDTVTVTESDESSEEPSDEPSGEPSGESSEEASEDTSGETSDETSEDPFVPSDEYLAFAENLLDLMGDANVSPNYRIQVSVSPYRAKEGEQINATLTVTDIDADTLEAGIQHVEFDFYYDSEMLELVYDDDFFGDEGEFIFEADHPGRATAWEHFSRFDPDDPGLIQIKYLTTSTKAAVKANGALVIYLSFTVKDNSEGFAGIYIRNDTVTGSTVNFERINGNGGYGIAETYGEYVVSFVDWDGALISEGTYLFGEPIGIPDDPVRDADETYTYEFDSWSPDVSLTCEGDATYTANYIPTYIDYTVIFLDDDGSVIFEGIYHYGDGIEVPDDPERDSDDTYDYYFDGWSPDVNTTCEGDATYTATYYGEYIDYTVTFLDYDGSVILEDIYHYGDGIEVPDDPERDSDETYVYYFDGWSPDVNTTCEGDATYTATYEAEYIEYTVIFINYDGELISEEVYHYGDDIEVPDDPTRDSDETYDYCFDGWNPYVSLICEGDATYTATYEAEYIEYTVIFINYDGELISEEVYHYGDPITVPDDPTRDSSLTFDFVFTGWLGELTETCEGDAVYMAAYDAVYIDYLVTFCDYDGTVLSEEYYHYDEPIYPPAAPSREEDEVYFYEFAGWSPAVPATCEGEATYVAFYDAIYIDYSVYFYDYDGSVISHEYYHYGDDITVPGDPARLSDETYNYYFDSWTPDVNTTCEGQAEYTAVYEAVYIDYTVTFVNYDGEVISEETYHYGDEIDVPDDPTRPDDAEYSYYFAGWEPEVPDNCEGDATYTAVYVRSDSTFTVFFLDYDGTVISVSNEYHYNDVVSLPDDPTREADDTFTYTFAGWSPAVTAVKGNATYIATYNAAYIEYTVKFVDFDGSVISSGTYHYGDGFEAPEDPARDADNTYTYAFAGWTPDVTYTCEGDATYTATYNATYIVYTVTYVNYDGTVLAADTYHYGDEIEVLGGASKPADETYTYEFAGWSPAVPATCEGSATYTATYNAVYIDYVVSFLDEDGAEISCIAYHYGDEIEMPENPSKPADNTYTYAFAGWTPAVVTTCTGSAEYTATYTATYIDYTVRFLDYNGAVISTATCHYGDEIDVPADPTRAEDDLYTYEFAGWTPEIVSTCAGSADYTATYNAFDKIFEASIGIGIANGFGGGQVAVVYGGDTVENAILAVKPADYILGDVNGNGIIDAADYLMTKRIVLATYEYTDDQFMRADLDGNNKVEALDYIKIKRHVLGTYEIPQPPVELGDDLAEYIVITVGADGKIVSVNAQIGVAKADAAIPEGGYAIIIHKDALEDNADFAAAIEYLDAGEEAAISNVDFSVDAEYCKPVNGAAFTVTYMK